MFSVIYGNSVFSEMFSVIYGNSVFSSVLAMGDKSDIDE